MLELVKSCIGTKFTSQFGDLIAVSIYNIKLYLMGVLMTFVLSLILNFHFLSKRPYDLGLSGLNRGN